MRAPTAILQYDRALLRTGRQLPAGRPHRCRGVTGRLLIPGACQRHATSDAGRDLDTGGKPIERVARPRPTLAAAQQLYEEIVEGAACVCGHCTADNFGVKAIHKLIDAYPDPIAVTDVEDYEDEDR